MARGLPIRMRTRGLGLDLQLAREGLLVGWHFGARSLGELVRIASYIETSVYERGSLRRTADGIRFRLTNPPLRLGAFDRATLWVDGAPIAPDRVEAVPAGAPEAHRFSDLSAERPLLLLPGRATDFRARLDPPPPGGRHLTLRMELHNVAIPPPVWLQFRDRVGRGEPS